MYSIHSTELVQVRKEVMGNEYKANKLDGRKRVGRTDERTYIHTYIHTAYWPPVPRVVNWLLSTLPKALASLLAG